MSRQLALPAGQGRSAALWVALVVLAMGIGVSAHALRGRIDEVRPVSLAVALLLTVPISIALSASRFRLVASIGGAALSFARCLRTVVLGTAVNFLPVPGGFAVRVHALRHLGLGRSIRLNLFATVVWLVASSAFAAVGAVALAAREAAGALAAAAGACAVVALVLARRHRYSAPKVLALLVLQSIISAIDIVRMVIIADSIALTLGWPAASVLGLSGVLGTMTGLLPSGIGITESLGALLLLAIGGSPAVGFLVTGLNRLALWIGIAPVAALLLRRRDEA